MDWLPDTYGVLTQANSPIWYVPFGRFVPKKVLAS